ncbi:acyl-CoA dehydrogenase family protein, partial [Pseudomonas fluorescens]|uniref:acyl-CoA dehydrogenase family protein n=2 Tax=Pseudomonas TaxID=286 RepID=UPI00177DF997
MNATVIRTDGEALAVADELARQLRRDSALRDRERRLPHAELELFSRSGLWAISVPKAFGGAGVSYVTLAKIIARIAQADGSLGQIPQNHFYALEVLRVNGTPEQQQRLYAEVLAGRRFGNALAELGTKTAHDRTTRLSREGDGYRINGRKFYSTGALYAQRIPTSVIDDDGVQRLAFVPADAPGLQVIDDWSGFGQRTTGSGSVVFD